MQIITAVSRVYRAGTLCATAKLLVRSKYDVSQVILTLSETLSGRPFASDPICGTEEVVTGGKFCRLRVCCDRGNRCGGRDSTALVSMLCANVNLFRGGPTLRGPRHNRNARPLPIGLPRPDAPGLVF